MGKEEFYKLDKTIGITYYYTPILLVLIIL